MLKGKQVLVNGCSFSCGENSWPYCLQKTTDCNIVNLSLAGAGNMYIHQSTVTELAKRSYDLVLVMWGGLSWVDCQVENINLFSNIEYTSLKQSLLNDWEDKIIDPINDQDYVEKNWVFAVTNNEENLRKMQFCNTQFKFVGKEQKLTHSLIHMISLQNTLKYLNIPYVFSFFKDYEATLTRHELYKFLDTKHIFNSVNLRTLAVENNMIDTNDHPKPEAHKIWAEALRSHLKTNTYAKKD